MARARRELSARGQDIERYFWVGSTRGIMYEVDPRRREIIIVQFKLEDAKATPTPGTHEEGTTSYDCAQEFGEKQASQYIAITARCNYISFGRFDAVHAAKGLARRVANVTTGDLQKPKRPGRYLPCRPRLQQVHIWQHTPSTLTISTDADWAGCGETRGPTTGGCAMLGEHAPTGWNHTHALMFLC